MTETREQTVARLARDLTAATLRRYAKVAASTARYWAARKEPHKAAYWGDLQTIYGAAACLKSGGAAWPERAPLCARSMGCLCAGHARGNPASAACDTTE